MFGNAVDCAAVRVHRRRWWPFQPRRVTMAPMGHLHFHPASDSYCDDFSTAPIGLQAHFIHEMTHVWQAQTRGRWYLVLRRHPLCRYAYSLKPGWPLERYGLEQQAEIVRHAFLLRRGVKLAGVAGRQAYELLVNFPGVGETSHPEPNANNRSPNPPSPRT
ncbi:MAG: hypothetical protein RL702_938 [Pseudomonadota bacterium]|jgi:hypothetical protein